MEPEPITTPSTEPVQMQTPPPVTPPDKNGGTSGGDDQEPTWLPKRLERARQAALSDFMKELGFDKPEDLKALVTMAKKKQEEDMTETQRLQTKLQALEQKATQAEQRAAEVEAARISDRLDASIRDVARLVSAQFPDDVVKFIRDAGDADELVSKEGVVDAEKVKKRVEAVKKERPLWFPTVRGNGPGIPSNNGGHAPEPGKDALKRASALSQRTIRG